MSLKCITLADSDSFHRLAASSDKGYNKISQPSVKENNSKTDDELIQRSRIRLRLGLIAYILSRALGGFTCSQTKTLGY